MPTEPLGTILCLASYEKGAEFMREARRLGYRVLLLTVTALEHAPWPRESLDDIRFMPDIHHVEDVILGVSYLARTQPITRIVALDDSDVETAAALREHMRLPGLDASHARLFHDKLAMRVRAREAGIPVPAFVPILTHRWIADYMRDVPPPWLLKPRAEASTVGITRIEQPDDLWRQLETLGDRQSFHLLEQYLPGAVCHVDALVLESTLIFAEAHQYARPPLDVFHQGGIAMTRTLPRYGDDARALKDLCQRVVRAFGMPRGVVHMEFIKRESDGQIAFLEVGARVGGAHIAEMVEASTGINLWREWARLELTPEHEEYSLPEHRADYGGVIITLARQEHPDTSAYQDPEIAWRMDERFHAGLVLRASEPERVATLLNEYSRRFAQDFYASLPAATDLNALRNTSPDAAPH